MVVVVVVLIGLVVDLVVDLVDLVDFGVALVALVAFLDHFLIVDTAASMVVSSTSLYSEESLSIVVVVLF